MPQDRKRKIFSASYLESVYDKFASDYASGRDNFDNRKQLEQLSRLILPHSQIVDLGCGTGIPVAKFFADLHHHVTGIDISSKMIRLAKKNVPQAAFVKGDINKIDPPKDRFDLIVSFYTLFHLTKKEQLALFPKIYFTLKPGGYVYSTFACVEYTGHKDFEGAKQFEGVVLPYSHFSEKKYEEILRKNGFCNIKGNKLKIGGETMLWVLAQKQN